MAKVDKNSRSYPVSAFGRARGNGDVDREA